MNLFEVLRRPLVTEKSTAQQALGKYSFEVAWAATKHEVKQAVEKAFDVSVIEVNVINMPRKSHRMGRRIVMSSPWKKAVVTLQEGDKIQIFEGV